MERLGKQAEVVSGDPVPPFLAFLPGVERVRRAPELEPDVAVVLDAGDLARTGSVARDHADWLARARIVNIDHHVSNPGFGEARAHRSRAQPPPARWWRCCCRSWASRSTRSWPRSSWRGIVQDTHTFAHPNATPRTLRVSADLVEAGARLSAINRAVYADKPFNVLRLWGLMLAGIAERRDGRDRPRRHDRRDAGADRLRAQRHARGSSTCSGSTREAAINVLFKEAEPGRVRVSVRTTARADAVAITRQFGGGGHARAAGCTVQGSLEEARALVLGACERELAEGDSGDDGSH